MSLACAWSLMLFSACSQPSRETADRLNDAAYACRYRNLDSTFHYASAAYSLSEHYGAGRAEAMNNIAFVSIARMDYAAAAGQLDEARDATNNEIEQLVADVQQMRICQRTADNRAFYEYRARAVERMKRIGEERGTLSDRNDMRMTYAETEYAIVSAEYYYHVGLDESAAQALERINPNGDIRRDTAQYLHYLCCRGALGAAVSGGRTEALRQETESLMECLVVADRHYYPYFAAAALESLADHFLSPGVRARLDEYDTAGMKYINPDDLPPDNLTIQLAHDALNIFEDYGDAYRTAAALRSLAAAYFAAGDYFAAIDCLDSALADDRIALAPILAADIHEQLSVACAAIDDKQASDYNRNIYLDLQEETRQDRELEARADMLDRITSTLNTMIVSVIAAIVLLLAVLALFYLLNRRSHGNLTRPQREKEDARRAELDRMADNARERLARLHADIRDATRTAVENRAKVALAAAVTPLVDRMTAEVRMLRERTESSDARAARYAYIVEIAEKINEYNNVLTDWITMRSGQVDLHIETFPLQTLFDIVAKSRTAFRFAGLTLTVTRTAAVVKADKTLTLFMINTLADNARKYTPAGGTVNVSADETDGYVEISVKDNGCGLSAGELARIFNRKIYDGHGFGLMNCRGIMDKYRKTSSIFNACIINADSVKGKGSRFFFRLPKGAKRTLTALLLLVPALSPAQPHSNNTHDSTLADAAQTAAPDNDSTLAAAPPHAVDNTSNLYFAKTYADSAYFSNIDGTYDRTLVYADSCRKYLNRHYLEQHPAGTDLMTQTDSLNDTPAEITWLRDSVAINYGIIADVRNETAVAALALHDWKLYNYNNNVYTRLVKELSADNTLADYCLTVQRSQSDKTIAVILLVIILLAIPPAYYLLYYRHHLRYRRHLEQLSADMLRNKEERIAAAEEDCRQADYELGRLHVMNAVVDNCLSTLKHETMYFPSRISRLARTTSAADHNDDCRKDCAALEEITAYYHDIYALLARQASIQAVRVTPHVTRVPVADVVDGYHGTEAFAGDHDTLRLLFRLLGATNKTAKKTAGKTPDAQARVAPVTTADTYICVEITGRQHAAAADLFAPVTDNIPMLVCRQITRDLSEATGLRGCGIDTTENGDLRVRLPRYTRTANHNLTVEI